MTYWRQIRHDPARPGHRHQRDNESDDPVEPGHDVALGRVIRSDGWYYIEVSGRIVIDHVEVFEEY